MCSENKTACLGMSHLAGIWAIGHFLAIFFLVQYVFLPFNFSYSVMFLQRVPSLCKQFCTAGFLLTRSAEKSGATSVKYSQTRAQDVNTLLAATPATYLSKNLQKYTPCVNSKYSRHISKSAKPVAIVIISQKGFGEN